MPVSTSNTPPAGRRSASVKRLAIAAILLALFAPAAWAESAVSVERFNQLKPRWSELAGVPLKIEGRYGSVLQNVLRFQHCDLVFKAEDPLPKFPREGRVVEVTGQLAEEDSRLVFLIESVKQLPPDSTTLRLKRSRIGLTADPQEWYDLAHWAKGRSKFYDDKELAELARKTFLFGIAAERRKLAAHDARGLFALADKMEKFGIAAAQVQEYRHHSYQLQWDAAKKNRRADLAELAARIARDLPDSKTPLPKPQPTLGESYWNNPLEVYHEADDAVRPLLHRLFYREVMLRAITLEAAADGSNGYRIADQIDLHLPEMSELAESYRERELAFKLAQAPSMTRSQVLALQERFVERNEPERGRQAVANWLEARRRRLHRDDAEGALSLSREYVELLDDQETAVDLLMAAHRRNPLLTVLSEQLNRYGYTWKDGRWLSADEAAELPADPNRQAMREGRVSEGMTPEQVRKTLGAPTSVARAASAGQISEVWTYGEPGTSRITIHFQRRSRQQQSQVVGISQTRP